MENDKTQSSTVTLNDHPSDKDNEAALSTNEEKSNKPIINFKKWVQEREDITTTSVHHVSPLIKLYWGIAEKHERHLKKKEVLPLEESEHDRQVISDAYKEALTPQELDFDRRAYRALVRMQELRDQSYLLEELDKRYKMELIAWELKIRQHPLFILPHITSEPTVVEEVVEELGTGEAIFLDQENLSGTPMNQWEIVSQPIILDTRRVAHPTARIEIDKHAREKIRNQLIKRLKGKTKSLTELSQQFSTLELQMLSKILSKKELIAIFKPRENKVTFLEPTQVAKIKSRNSLRKCAMVIESSAV